MIYHFTKYRILYLDFDGVLHDEEVYWDAKRGIYLSTPNRILFEWVDILERLVEKHADVRIVLSTSWVPIKSFNYAKRCLSPLLQSLVIGSTYHSKYMRRDEFMSLPRGIQIIQDVFRRKTELWLAIDDDYIGWPVSSRKNLICTDGSQGINARDVQCAIAQWLEKTA